MNTASSLLLALFTPSRKGERALALFFTQP